MAEAAPLHDLVQCSICLGRLTQAKMLPCQHTFCLQCLHDLVPQDVRAFSCPTCRRRIQIPKTGLKGFKDNLLVNNLLDMVEEQAECFECGRENVLKRCTGHCGSKLCKDCCSVHKRLKEEIEQKFDVIRERVGKVANQRESVGCVDDNGESIEIEVHEAFDNAIKILLERREQLTKQIRETVKFQKMLSLDNVDNELLLDRIKSCDNVQKLTEMKDWFATLDTEKEFVNALAEGYRQEFSFDLAAVESFGRIDCGGVEFGQLRNAKGAEPQATRKSDKATSTHDSKIEKAAKNVTSGIQKLLPTHVDYKSKRFALRERCPISVLVPLVPGFRSGKVAAPHSVVYSTAYESVYCLFSGNVVAFTPREKNVGYLSLAKKDITDGIGLAVTKSGKLLVLDCRSVKYFDLKDLKPPSAGEPNEAAVKSLLVGLSKPIQICSWGKEFAVLDFGRKCLNIFTEEGRMIREIKVPDVRRDSKMCLDKDGNIHILILQAEKSSVERFLLEWSMYVSVVSWNGEGRGRLLLDRGQTNYRSYTGTESDIHTMIINNALKKFGDVCVDGDGKIAVTRPEERCIEIYFPKMVANFIPEMDEIGIERAYYRVFREALTTFGMIKQQESPLEIETSIGGFDHPISICWTPDGRLICCDESGMLMI